MTAQCGNDNLRVFARHLDQHGKARMTFHQSLRWTATGLLEAEKKFRRIKGYQEILLLKDRLNLLRIQQKEDNRAEVA